MNGDRDLPEFSGLGSDIEAASRWRPGARVGVIGGRGEMGRLFAGLFDALGYPVEISDIDGPCSNREVVESAEVVIFAVPLHLTEDIIEEMLPHVRAEQLLMDLTSLKSGPVARMLKSPASVVGLHPMFGGRVSSLVGQTLAACPVRIDRGEWEALRGLFTTVGMRVKACTPEEHDRMMSVIQVLFHVTTMLTGRVIRTLGVDINETLEYTSPSYRIEMSLLGRIFAQNSALYAAITQMNPHTGKILGLLRDSLDDFELWCRDGDLSAIIGDFEQSARHLGEFSQQAYRESSAILDFAVKWVHQNDGGGEE